MTPAIRMLESLGQRPLGAADPSLDDAWLAAGGLPRQQRQALLARDMPSLVEALRGRRTLYCMLTTPEQAPAREPDEREDDRRQDDEAPDQDDPPDAAPRR